MKFKFKIGKNAKYSGFGRRGMSRGMYSGGYTFWVYGIAGLIALEALECWGDFNDMKL